MSGFGAALVAVVAVATAVGAGSINVSISDVGQNNDSIGGILFQMLSIQTNISHAQRWNIATGCNDIKFDTKTIENAMSCFEGMRRILTANGFDDLAANEFIYKFIFAVYRNGLFPEFEGLGETRKASSSSS